jgi:hypothetical protein
MTGTSAKLVKRIETLEARLKPVVRIDRVILWCRTTEGNFLKLADTNPEEGGDDELLAKLRQVAASINVPVRK